jgi:hypothetical protein
MKRTILSPSGLAICIAFAAIPACRRNRATPPPPANPPTPAAPAADEDDPDLTRDLAAELARAFQRESVPATADGTRVHVGNHDLTAHARVLQVVSEEVTTAAIDVSLDLDGRPEEAFHVTAIAHDRSRADALQHAIREWSVANGIPIVRAMQPREALTADAGSGMLHIGPYDVFPGPMGARGEVPADWDAQTNRITAALVARIEPELGGLLATNSSDHQPAPRASRYRGLRFTMHVRGGVGGEGDCRVDNVENEHLCELIRTYAWPHVEGESDGYIVKQYFLLTAPSR